MSASRSCDMAVLSLAFSKRIASAGIMRPWSQNLLRSAAAALRVKGVCRCSAALAGVDTSSTGPGTLARSISTGPAWNRSLYRGTDDGARTRDTRRACYAVAPPGERDAAPTGALILFLGMPPEAVHDLISVKDASVLGGEHPGATPMQGGQEDNGGYGVE